MRWSFKGSCWGLLPGACLLVPMACQPSDSSRVPFMRLEQMRPRPSAREGVYLNEALVFHFSAEIDPSSVTRESLVVRALGRREPAAGAFLVDGDMVRFLPDLGLQRDLSDGGLRPGTRYEVLLRGFPAPDGLRSVAGRPLNRSARLTFETARLTQPREQMFEDRNPDRRPTLTMQSRSMQEEESLFLYCATPIDPSTLVDGEFLLQSTERPAEDRVPLDPVLRENSRTSGAKLELIPRRILAKGTYVIPPNLDPSLRDFGGKRVWPLSLPSGLRVQVRGREGALPIWTEPFLDTRGRSPLVVQGVDGSAAWLGDGRVTIRYPAAAGSGADGAMVLAGPVGHKDVHATRLEVPEGSEVELLSVPGLVVLRAQGVLRVAGELSRRSGPAEEMVFEPRGRLSSWLTAAQSDERNWTVLIAGGDLVLEGVVDVEGPLLLVAGGRIRVTGQVKAQDRQLWVLGSRVGGGSDPTASQADLVIDPPELNPLVEALTFAVVSGPMPPAGGVRRWGAPEYLGEARGGHFSVRYLPPTLKPGGSLQEWGVADSPRDLVSAEALRLLLFLTMEPADPEGHLEVKWDPPVIDDVRLEWEPR